MAVNPGFPAPLARLVERLPQWPHGIPAALAAAMLPAPAANLVMIPASVGTRWVATVARVAAALEPHGGLAAMAWMVLGAALVAPAVWRWRRGGSRMPI